MPRCQRGDPSANLGSGVHMPQQWTAYDKDTGKMKLLNASNHKEAIKKAVNKYDIVPNNTHDVRPRTGDANLMSEKEFNNFMEAGLV